MANFLVILLCLSLGMILKASGRLGAEGSRVVNGLVINLSLPAMVLTQLRHLEFTSELLVAVSAPWLLFALNCGIIVALGKFLRWRPEVTGALALTTGLANTSFVGFPLLEALIGPEALRVGVVVDQLGSFLILSTAALIVLGVFSRKNINNTPLWKRVLFFPPLAAVLMAVALNVVPSPSPAIADAIYASLERLAVTLIPLALISVGLQLTWNTNAWRDTARYVALGLVLKLVIAPALLALFYFKVLGLQNQMMHIALLEVAMAPMITGAILAIEGGLDRHVASAMVFVGIPVSLVTVPLWNWLLK